jgi:hypothetical protein
MRFENLEKMHCTSTNYEKVRQFVASGEGKQIQDEIRNIVNKAQKLSPLLCSRGYKPLMKLKNQFCFVDFVTT